MRQLWLVVALAGTGCNQILGIDELTRIDAGGIIADSSVVDGRPIDAPPESVCAMLVLPAQCYSPEPTGAIVIAGLVNTDTDPRCADVMQATGPTLCAIVGGSITIPVAGATVTGAKPLLLVATDTITVTGILDASSTIATTPRLGPGAATNPATCGLPAAGGGTDGGGGGAGGTFTTKGGDGGDGSGTAGGSGATATAPITTTVVRAGCRGTQGGNTNNGAGGSGGGAIYLTAGMQITIANRLIANGAAGSGATDSQAGGGGGGSGGMIVLEAPTITLMGAAQISANGAGGGEGTFDTTADDGNESTAWNLAAAGGNGGSNGGGGGGNGSVNALGGVGGANGTGPSGDDGGGGGGGGGGGLVWIRGTLAGTQPISPPPVMK